VKIPSPESLYVSLIICLMPGLATYDYRSSADLVHKKVSAYLMRVQSAYQQNMVPPAPRLMINPNEKGVRNYAASFSKTLEHDPVTGELTTQGAAQFEQLVRAMNSGKQEDFNAIVRAPSAQSKFICPQAAFDLSLEGRDSSLFTMPPFPELRSAQAAAQMIEVYLKAICRDVHFSDYGTGENSDKDTVNGGSITKNAATIIHSLGDAYRGSRTQQGDVDHTVLFRGVEQGCCVGPYISQFLLLPTYVSLDVNNPQEPRYPIGSQREFGITFDDFVTLQNGSVARKRSDNDVNKQQKRFIMCGRDIANCIHNDPPDQFYRSALNTLITLEFPYSPYLPYFNGSMPNEGDFLNMSSADVCALIALAAQEALKAAWTQKWCVQRNLRPEAFAARVHRAKVSGNNMHHLHDSLFATYGNIDLLAWVQAYNLRQVGLPGNEYLTQENANTYLLAQVYPEGSPIHPSSPAAHASMAGACTTVIKAFFDTDVLIASKITPVKPDIAGTSLIPLTSRQGDDKDLLTVGGELDKLASNISIGRNIAGVHYRFDADQGIALGEEVAIRVLQDHARTYPEAGFKGFMLTKRDGTKIRITAHDITIV
jgi:hypothetical protein